MAGKKAKPYGNYSAAQFARVLDEHANSIALPAGINCPKAPNAFVKQREQSKLGAAKLPNGKTIDDQLNSAANPEVKTALDEALKLTAKTEEAKDNFTASIKALNEVLAEKPALVDAFSFTDRLHELKSEFVAAIKAQQAEEIVKLTNYFNNGDNATSIRTAFGIPDDVNIDDYRDAYIAALTEEHKTQITAFEKEVNDELVNIFKEIEKSAEKINILATTRYGIDPDKFAVTRAIKNLPIFGTNWYQPLPAQSPKKMREAIEEQVKASRLQEQEGEDVRAGINAPKKPRKGEFRDVDIDKLNLQTLSGKVIKRLGPNHFQIKVSGVTSWYQPGFYSEKDLAKDTYSLAKMVRAQGHDSIKYTLDYKDEKEARKVAAIAYREAIKAGFDPEKISIVLPTKEGTKELKGAALEKYLDIANDERTVEAKKEQNNMKTVLQSVREKHGSKESNQTLKELEAKKKVEKKTDDDNEIHYTVN